MVYHSVEETIVCDTRSNRKGFWLDMQRATKPKLVHLAFMTTHPNISYLDLDLDYNDIICMLFILHYFCRKQSSYVKILYDFVLCNFLLLIRFSYKIQGRVHFLINGKNLHMIRSCEMFT